MKFSDRKHEPSFATGAIQTCQLLFLFTSVLSYAHCVSIAHSRLIQPGHKCRLNIGAHGDTTFQWGPDNSHYSFISILKAQSSPKIYSEGAFIFSKTAKLNQNMYGHLVNLDSRVIAIFYDPTFLNSDQRSELSQIIEEVVSATNISDPMNNSFNDFGNEVVKAFASISLMLEGAIIVYEACSTLDVSPDLVKTRIILPEIYIKRVTAFAGVREPYSFMEGNDTVYLQSLGHSVIGAVHPDNHLEFMRVGGGRISSFVQWRNYRKYIMHDFIQKIDSEILCVMSLFYIDVKKTTSTYFFSEFVQLSCDSSEDDIKDSLVWLASKFPGIPFAIAKHHLMS